MATGRYTPIHSKIWYDKFFRSLSHENQRVALYLLTSPLGNIAGIFRLPLMYASYDLSMSIDQVRTSLSSLSGWASYDEANEVVLLHTWLFEYPLLNAKQLIGAKKVIKDLFSPLLITFREIIETAPGHGPHLCHAIDELIDKLLNAPPTPIRQDKD